VTAAPTQVRTHRYPTIPFTFPKAADSACMPAFRETLWFKRGEMVEDEESVPLPIEDRYLEDGSLARGDSEVYGLHSGQTSMLPVLLNKEIGRRSSPELGTIARELRGDHRPMLALAGASIVVAATMLALWF
jgi:hypothetical protein